MDKDTKLNKEDIDNLVAIFSLLLKWDVKQNPHLYKKEKTLRNQQEIAVKQALL